LLALGKHFWDETHAKDENKHGSLPIMGDLPPTVSQHFITSSLFQEDALP